MYKRLFPRMAFCFTLITSFLFMPLTAVYADGYNQDTDFWRWWYIEHQTDAITEGQGASAENIEDTDSGQTAGTVIYNQSGVTRGELIDYVEEQYNQAEGYLQKGVEYYVNAVNNVYDSTVTATTKTAYQTEKAVREVVDSTGKVIVDVSGSDFWHSAYNGLFNNNGYKDVYVQGEAGNYSGIVDGHTFSIRMLGLGRVISYNSVDSSIYDSVMYFPTGYRKMTDCNIDWSNLGNMPQCLLSVVVDGVQFYVDDGTGNPGADSNNYTYNGCIYTESQYQFDYSYVNRYSGYLERHIYVYLNGNATNQDDGSTPVLQPKQCGFIIYNGNRVPVYTDPSQNPFSINDDGTVDYNGTNYPIYVDPDEISPDGWLKILEYIDNQDQTENPYNPQGQPWNTQPDGSALGGFFSNLIKDISSIFDGIGNAISNLIDKVIKAIKDIANIIIDALKKFWNLLIGDVDDYATLFETDVNDNFDLISDLYDLLLQCIGVDA